MLSINELRPDKVEIVAPVASIPAQPPLAVVDKTVYKKGTREVAQAYLDFLYSETGQDIAACNYYRPISPDVAARDAAQFREIELFTVEEVAGRWTKAQKQHFGDGGILEQIY